MVFAARPYTDRFPVQIGLPWDYNNSTRHKQRYQPQRYTLWHNLIGHISGVGVKQRCGVAEKKKQRCWCRSWDPKYLRVEKLLDAVGAGVCAGKDGGGSGRCRREAAARPYDFFFFFFGGVFSSGDQWKRGVQGGGDRRVCVLGP